MTPAQLQANFALYSNFDYPVNVERARKFIQVCRQILGSGIAEWQHGQERMRFDLQFIRAEMERAILFVQRNDTQQTATMNTLGSLENFRA